MNNKLVQFLLIPGSIFRYGRSNAWGFIILASIICSPQSHATIYDTVVVGAGISGLAAAKQLQENNHKVLILEARDRIGGRIWSVNTWGTTLDLGASWLHGVNNNPVSQLVEQASIKTVPTSYNADDLRQKLRDMVFYDEQGEKISQEEVNATIPLVLNFEQFFKEIPNKKLSLNTAFELFSQKQHLNKRQLSLLKYQVISSYAYEFAGDLDQLSVDVDKPYDNSEVSGKQVVFPKGYIQVANLLAQHLPIRLNQVVARINYEQPLIKIDTQDQQYLARTVIITIPVSLLQAKKISFNPPLPAQKTTAFSQIKMGTYDKIFLYFKDVFWDKDKEWIGFVQSEPAKYPVLDIMNYYKISKHPILLIFNTGKQAEEFEQLPDQQILSKIMQELRIIYGKDIPDPSSYVMTRWHNDPYALGAYSHLAPNVSIDNYQIIGAPVNNRLFFAGEATSLTDPATVHGAYLSGIRAATEVETVITPPSKIAPWEHLMHHFFDDATPETK